MANLDLILVLTLTFLTLILGLLMIYSYLKKLSYPQIRGPKGPDGLEGDRGPSGSKGPEGPSGSIQSVIRYPTTIFSENNLTPVSQCLGFSGFRYQVVDTRSLLPGSRADNCATYGVLETQCTQKGYSSSNSNDLILSIAAGNDQINQILYAGDLENRRSCSHIRYAVVNQGSLVWSNWS